MRKLGLKLIDIYIIRKFIGTYFYAILLIVGIAVVFDVAEKMDDFMEKGAPLNAIVFDYYMNFIPYFANLFSSLFTFIAVIFFTSKMAYNTEIIAILSAGVSFKRMMFPYFLSAAIIAVFSFMLSNFVIPPANRVRLDFENTYIKKPVRNTDRNIHRQVRPGIFIYMQSYNTYSSIGYKFSMEKYVDGELKSKLISEFVKWDTTINKWNINNYYIRNFSEEGEEVITGKRIDSSIYVTPADFTRRVNVVESMNMFELDEFIEQQKLQGTDNVDFFLIEKYNRIAYPFATFILTLIGVSLSSRKIRGGIGLHIGLGLALSFSFILFMRFSTMFAVGGNIPPFVSVWIPSLLYAVIGIILYRLAPK
ncbi:MAG TPA: LptF/LptG family permease [Tenuifilaceae bacterium]|nr:LptF/LptG family permease [Tenuifilaceae bacterium]HPE18869.1 LptF/LptG family permease [Tenuifilaceae bacterium]HPJ46340.1 LptF/LptG family permease [Tenuifilaceae bacterium]HPQ35037.1 LptF/LptG family permease [Tenuifilaceae bacterium]HRX68340.1 LptF/LptG family permease [Tenuifilaceae bacterium]